VQENLRANGSTRCVLKNFHGSTACAVLFSGSSLSERKLFLHDHHASLFAPHHDFRFVPGVELLFELERAKRPPSRVEARFQRQGVIGGLEAPCWKGVGRVLEGGWHPRWNHVGRPFFDVGRVLEGVGRQHKAIFHCKSAIKNGAVFDFGPFIMFQIFLSSYKASIASANARFVKPAVLSGCSSNSFGA
jgi:hypothetical protein